MGAYVLLTALNHLSHKAVAESQSRDAVHKWSVQLTTSMCLLAELCVQLEVRWRG